MSLSSRVVILGAGHAGGTLAGLLRQYGWTGPITLVGEEPLAPYQRPPLSKAWLKGEATAESLALRPEASYAAHGIGLRLSTKAVMIDRSAKMVSLQSDETLPYDVLVLALGSRLRKLPVPGAGLPGVLELRSAADADRIKVALKPGVRLAVIGGGYIGLEVAASARALGASVTLFERERRLLARVASEPLSAFFDKRHRAEGVEILLGAAVEALEAGPSGGVGAIALGDGRRVACDVAVVGVGALANEDMARDAGIACNDGILVDLEARTSDPSIFAIGDCTRRPLPHYGRLARLESVPNALEQAKHVASALCGKPAPAAEVPWFWSDQYDVKLQIAGMPFDVTESIVRGDPEQGRFAIFLRDAKGAVRAVEAVNSPAEFMGGRLLIASRKVIDAGSLVDMSIPMKELMARG